jgi:chromosome segregation ATPase
MDKTASYCAALMDQEKSLEELQKHLRTTEDLFRESVKRKNQQLDLLQSEVRRLKTSVNTRDELTAAQMEAALGAQGGELQTLRERMSRREAEVDSLMSKIAGLEEALQLERQRSAEANERAEAAEAARAHGSGEAAQLRERLADTQQALQQAAAGWNRRPRRPRQPRLHPAGGLVGLGRS